MYKYEEPSIFSGHEGRGPHRRHHSSHRHRLGVLHRPGRQADSEGHSARRDRPDRQAERRRQAAAPAAEARRDQAVRSAARVRRHPGSAQQTNAITETTQVQKRRRRVAAPPPVQHTQRPRSSRSEASVSEQRGLLSRTPPGAPSEEGRCMVKLTVAADGSITDPSIADRSGSSAPGRGVRQAGQARPAHEAGHGGRQAGRRRIAASRSSGSSIK